jgi:hypothetical protein
MVGYTVGNVYLDLLAFGQPSCGLALVSLFFLAAGLLLATKTNSILLRFIGIGLSLFGVICFLITNSASWLFLPKDLIDDWRGKKPYGAAKDDKEDEQQDR